MAEFSRNNAIFIFQCDYQIVALHILQVLRYMHHNFNSILCLIKYRHIFYYHIHCTHPVNWFSTFTIKPY